MEKYYCVGCAIEIIKTRTTVGKYCSNACQKKYESNQKMTAWLNNNEKVGKRVVRRYLKETHGDECSVCGIEDWLGEPINFEIDHSDGDPYNNRPENLRMLCPNCHSQTPTYKNRNKGFGRKLRQSEGWLLV